MAKKPQGGGGAPEWLVTFADLMSLLVCFFVLIISFSVQDTQKLQVVAGSVKDAFGMQTAQRRAGVIEIDGSPMRRYIRRQTLDPSDNKETDEALEKALQKARQYPEQATSDLRPIDSSYNGKYASAVASLRQSWQAMPEIKELSKTIIMYENKDGLNIELVDQDGRPMFAEYSNRPYPQTIKLLSTMAKSLRDMPNLITITGHTAADNNEPIKANNDKWQLTTTRANETRKVLIAAGIDNNKFYSITGMSSNQPLFPDDPYLAANNRISIVLIDEPPPIPTDYQP